MKIVRKKQFGKHYSYVYSGKIEIEFACGNDPKEADENLLLKLATILHDIVRGDLIAS